NRGYEPLLRGHPDLDATLGFDRRGQPNDSGPLSLTGKGEQGGLGYRLITRPLRRLAGYGRFLRACRERNFDLVVDLQGLLRSGIMALACGASRRVGLSTAREGARWFYTDVVPVVDFNALHAVDRYWLAAEVLGAGDGPKIFRVPIAETERRWA